MIEFLIFAFIAGLVTIFAPCIWPVLPLVLSSTTTGGKQKPLGITLGIILSFLFFTLTFSYLVRFFHLNSSMLRLVAALVIGFLGFSLLIPALSARLEIMLSHLSSVASKEGTPSKGTGFLSGFIVGFFIGIVWSPCAGPILAAIVALAATQEVTTQVVLVAVVYVFGIGVPLFIFSELGSWLFTRSRFFNRYTSRVQQVFGAIMILMAFSIYTNYDKVVEARLLDVFPGFSTAITKFESSHTVRQGLEKLKGGVMMVSQSRESGDLQAPDFVGISQWLNTPSPLSLAQLRGKVVLVDFWTYTCINCIRTLPHVTAWYDTYKDEGFVVVGVHTPEFEFEKNADNVLAAIKRYHIHYPVAQDNDYRTWRAYNNEYWPAEYLIDPLGRIRHTHFGEGDYDETEAFIRRLLTEAGSRLSSPGISHLADVTPQALLTPETYLGSARMERFASNENVTGRSQSFTFPDELPLHHFAYQGTWKVAPQAASANQGSELELRFLAAKVFLVITPGKASDRVKVFLDAHSIPQSQAGEDVKNGELMLDTSRLYRIVDLRTKTERHVLRLQFENQGDSVFAFTFG